MMALLLKKVLLSFSKFVLRWPFLWIFVSNGCCLRLCMGHLRFGSLLEVLKLQTGITVTIGVS